MLPRRNRGYPWGVIGLSLLALSASVHGDATGIVDGREKWREFGTMLLYRLGTQHRPSIEWIAPGLQIADPNSRETIRAMKATMQRAISNYGHEITARGGRIPLDAHPQCLHALCLAEQFPDTRLGNWGRGQFAMCIEQAFLAIKPRSNSTRFDLTEEVLLAIGKPQGASSQHDAFAPTEIPYLCLYLIHSVDSEDVRSKARKRLALSLRERYGLEPGLGAFLALPDQGHEMDGTYLKIAVQLEQIGSRTKAKKIYTQVLENTASVDQATQAVERLTRILLLESKHGEAVATYDILFRRFPEAKRTIPDVERILNRIQEHREETSIRLVEELTGTASMPQSFQLCRSFSGLYNPEEASEKWQAVVGRSGRGSPAEKLSRLFHARAMADAGKIDDAALAVQGLGKSTDPIIQAQSLVISAEIARARDQWDQSVQLHARALQIDRPTHLPDWCKEFLRFQPSQMNTPKAGLQIQAHFLKGCNDLIDGDYNAAIDALSQAARDSVLLPPSMRSVLPQVMMLAWLGIEDYAEAEALGYQAIETFYRTDHNDDTSRDLLAQTQDLDATLCKALAEARNRTDDGTTGCSGLQNALDIAEAGTTLGLLATHTQPIRGGVQQLYVRAKKRHTAQVLTAEYRYIEQLSAESQTAQQSSCSEPLLFASQILSENSIDRIRENLASLAGDAEATDGWLCKFSLFAQRIKQLNLAMNALDTVTNAQAFPAYMEALEGIAGTYLASSSHQKAIDVYRRIARHSTDPREVQGILFRVVNIYAENLKDYGNAIQECEELVTRYPDGALASQLEFAMGRFAYLRGDYAGAVGQLDSFLRRYPEDQQVGQAMTLAGLSRMAQGNTQDASDRFREIIRRYPDTELAARSKFLIGYAQVSNQQYAMAIETLRQLIEQFPQSQYVPQAKNLIDRLQKVSQ